MTVSIVLISTVSTPVSGGNKTVNRTKLRTEWWPSGESGGGGGAYYSLKDAVIEKNRFYEKQDCQKYGFNPGDRAWRQQGPAQAQPEGPSDPGGHATSQSAKSIKKTNAFLIEPSVGICQKVKNQ